MLKQMRDMEQAFEVRIEDERIATEQKFVRKLQIVSREIARREEAMTDDEVRAMQAQLKFYESRVADMQREHKAVLQRLLPGASAASGEGGAAVGAGAAEQESGETLRQRCALLEAQAAVLQSESDEKSEALEVKRRQQNESRLVLEEADSVIRQLEAKVKGLEDQNDRLREELKVRRTQQQPDEAAASEEVLEQVKQLEGVVEAERAKSAALEKARAEMEAVLSKKQRQALGLEAQAASEGSAPAHIPGLQVCLPKEPCKRAL